MEPSRHFLYIPEDKILYFTFYLLFLLYYYICSVAICNIKESDLPKTKFFHMDFYGQRAMYFVKSGGARNSVNSLVVKLMKEFILPI